MRSIFRDFVRAFGMGAGLTVALVGFFFVLITANDQTSASTLAGRSPQGQAISRTVGQPLSVSPVTVSVIE